MIARLAVASTPTFLIGLLALPFIPAVALAVAGAGFVLAILVAGLTRDRLGSLVGGLAIALPLAVIALIMFVRACEEGGNYCN